MSGTLNYMRKRKTELRSQIDPHYSENFLMCWDLISDEMVSNFSDVTPNFVRKVEALEGFLFSFIQHLYDQVLLERFVKDMASLSVRSYESGRFDQ